MKNLRSFADVIMIYLGIKFEMNIFLLIYDYVFILNDIYKYTILFNL